MKFSSRIALFIILFCSPFFVYAKSYELKLFVREDGGIVFDRDFQPAIKLVEVNLNSAVSQSDFYVELVSIQAKTPILILPINVPNLGKFVLNLPFIPDVGSIEIKKQPEAQVLFSTNVSSLAVCNLNGKCESNLKENKDNCYADCLLEGYVAPDGAIDSSLIKGCYSKFTCIEFYKSPYSIVGGVLILLGVAGLVFIIKRRKNRSFNQFQISEGLPSSIPSEPPAFKNGQGEQILNNRSSQIDKTSPVDTNPPQV
ncbi:MAG: hypothetical protein HYW77_01810 [Parcubacteria group bacterium]|nr:hypothetical protein [Parcubacteria group bacterium]